jgi:hypothetical protein
MKKHTQFAAHLRDHSTPLELPLVSPIPYFVTDSLPLGPITKPDALIVTHRFTELTED